MEQNKELLVISTTSVYKQSQQKKETSKIVDTYLKIQNTYKQIIRTILVGQHLLLYCFSYSVNKLHVVTCRQAAVDPKLSHLNKRKIKFAIRPIATPLP